MRSRTHQILILLAFLSHATVALAQFQPPNPKAQTLLMTMATGSTESVVQLLKDPAYRAVVNTEVQGVGLPLSLAVAGGKNELVTALLEAGADINKGDINGFTALTWAVRRYKPDFPEEMRASVLATIRQLIKAGAIVDVPTIEIRKPISFAKAVHAKEVVAMLEEAQKEQARMQAARPVQGNAANSEATPMVATKAEPRPVATAPAPVAQKPLPMGENSPFIGNWRGSYEFKGYDLRIQAIGQLVMVAPGFGIRFSYTWTQDNDRLHVRDVRAQMRKAFPDAPTNDPMFDIGGTNHWVFAYDRDSDGLRCVQGPEQGIRFMRDGGPAPVGLWGKEQTAALSAIQGTWASMQGGRQVTLTVSRSAEFRFEVRERDPKGEWDVTDKDSGTATWLAESRLFALGAVKNQIRPVAEGQLEIQLPDGPALFSRTDSR